MYLLKRAIDGQVSDLKRLLGLNKGKVNERDDDNLTALHYAAWYNRAEPVDMLLSYGADANAKDVNDATPLHYAARHKQRFTSNDDDIIEQKRSIRNIIQSLAKAHADVNARDRYGDTPLFFAVLRGNYDAVEELLSLKDIDVDSIDNRHWTTLHVAAKYNRLDIMNLLVEGEAQLRPRTDRNVTPMHVAAMEGYVPIMQLLLENFKEKASRILMNDETIDGETPLDLAIENRKREAVKLCLESGANVRKTCRDVQSSTLHIAAATGDAEICLMILEKDKKMVYMRNAIQETPLHRAITYDRFEASELLLNWMSEIDARDHYNFTPLHKAVYHGSNRCVARLLERIANIRSVTKADQTVIHIAASQNRLNTMKILLEELEKKHLVEEMISADDRTGNSPLHLAAAPGYTQIVELLLRHGADISNKNEDEETPLHVAAANGRSMSVTALLKYTVDLTIVNDTDEDSNTPLHLAAGEGHGGSVKALLDAGADIGHRNRLFWTPLACAASAGHLEAVEVLVEAGSDISAIDRTKASILHLAAEKGHKKVVEYLLKKSAPVTLRDTNGSNPLDAAIKFGQKKVAMAIILSDQWKDALRNRTPGTRKEDNHDTPLRKLIRKMPDVAEKVFDKCILYPGGTDIKDPDLQIEFDFEFLDDTYAASSWGDPEIVNVENATGKVYTPDKKVLPEAKPYTDNSVTRQDNHPLTVMVRRLLLQVYNARGDLLYHPLVLALVKHKWRLAQVSYFSFLLFFVFYVAIYTNVIVMSKPPFMYDQDLLSQAFNSTNNTFDCSIIDEFDFTPEERLIVLPWRGIAKLLVWIMSAGGLVIEFFQLYHTPSSYMWSPTNVLDIFTYVSAALVLVPFRPCGLWTNWQWQLGTTTMFIAWMDLILFLRRLPGVGIYIVMVGEVFLTFVKFFAFCFSLFIFAFGFTFYALLRNQEPFETPGYAFAKTLVMMIGEIDYGDIFHGEDEFASTVFYESLTYALFIIFLCMVTIVIMNLLTGLAVGDVQEIQEHAKLKKLAMQVNLALDVEMSLPEAARKKLNCVIGKQTLSPNRMVSKFMNIYAQFMNGPLASKAIASAIFSEVEEQVEEEAHLEERMQQERLQNFQESMIKKMQTNHDRLDDLNDKLDSLQKNITLLLERT